jgi:hypothetical protein
MIAAANNNKKTTIKIMFLLTYIHNERELHFQKHNFLTITQVSFFAWKINQIWGKAFQMRWLWPEYINISS